MMKIVCGTLLDEDKFLIGQRLESNPKFPNKWELPGGKVEEGESPDDAIVREWKEELDIEIKTYYLIPERELHGLMVYPYLIKYKSGKPRLNEHQKVKWITLDEISDYDFTPITKKILYIIRGSYQLFLNKKSE
jgi:8-oxo-dGTP diphosphatase|tara:strand:+ start:10913 stop:11314 length:402 start_codon:yes stop_codon:yes gene_type:complete